MICETGARASNHPFKTPRSHGKHPKNLAARRFKFALVVRNQIVVRNQPSLQKGEDSRFGIWNCKSESIGQLSVQRKL